MSGRTSGSTCWNCQCIPTEDLQAFLNRLPGLVLTRKQSLSIDENIEAAKRQFFYEAVDLASCTKYLDQVADPDDWDEFENE
jgi:hypothetical protein